MWIHAWDPDPDDLFSTPALTQADRVKRAVLEHSFGLIFEDDTEVSPLFFQWLHESIRTYYAGENTEREGPDNDFYDSHLNSKREASSTSDAELKHEEKEGIDKTRDTNNDKMQETELKTHDPDTTLTQIDLHRKLLKAGG